MEREPYHDMYNVFHDVCFWCGLEECQDNHEHERAIYRLNLHREAIHRISVDGLMPDHRKMYRLRHKKLLDWFEERRKAVLAANYSGRRGRPKSEITLEVLFSLRPEQMGYFEHRLKETYRLKVKVMPEAEAWKLAMKEARRAKRTMENNAWLDKFIKKGSLLPTNN